MIASRDLDGSMVSGNFIDQPIDSVLSAVARSVGTEVIPGVGLYYFGSRRPEDVSVLVRRVMRLDETQIRSAVAGFLASGGTLSVLPDGLVIVGDRLEVLERISEIFDLVAAAPSVVWCVQLHVVSMSDRDLVDFGLDVQPALELALGYAKLSNVARDVAGGLRDGLRDGARAELDSSLSAVLRAARQRGSVAIIADPLMTIVDGSQARVTKGLSIPVRDSVTNATTGNVQSSVRFIQTGLEISATVREMSDTLARLKVELSFADVVETREGAPLTDRQSLDTSADVATGGVYVLGAIRRGRSESSQGSFLRLGKRDNVEGDVWVVFAKTYRIEQGLEGV